MPASSSNFATGSDRLLWWLLLAMAALAASVFAFGVAQRLGYPFELEWMEGALADHASRVAHGLPLYCAPSPEHVPFLYAPLQFWLGGLGIALGLDAVFCLRIVAVLGTIGTALLIGHWVRRETGHARAGLVASGSFLAGYGWLAWWFDLARNDTLFVCCMVATAYRLRHGGQRRWAWAALLAVLALLTKQSTLMWLPAIGVGALLHDWRTALRFAVAAAVGMLVAVGALHWHSDGWSTFFLFEMPRHHGIVGDRKLGFWTQDIVPMSPLLALGLAGFLGQWRAGRRTTALFLAAFGSGALVTSWLLRLHVGGFDNVLMYGFAGACVVAPIAVANLQPGPWRVLALCVWGLQFGWLGVEAWQRGVATWLPSAAHRRAHDELAAFVRAQPGPVWIPGHGAISTRAGKGTGAHGQAVFDLLQLLPKGPGGLDLTALFDRSKLAHLPPFTRQAIGSLIDGTNGALRRKHFAAIVLEHGTSMFDQVFATGLVGVDGRLGTADDTYVRSPTSPVAEPKAIAPLLGYDVHSPWVLVPNRD